MATVAGSTVDAWIHGGRMDPQWQQLPLAATVGRSIGGEAQIQAQLGYGLFRFFCFLFDLPRRAPNRLEKGLINRDLPSEAF